MRDRNRQSEMTFLDHLEELRWHILRSAMAILIIAIIAFIYKSVVFDIVLLGPSKSGFLTNRLLCWLGKNSFVHTERLCINTIPLKLQNIQMAGQFTAHIKISIISG